MLRSFNKMTEKKRIINVKDEINLSTVSYSNQINVKILGQLLFCIPGYA